MKSKYFPTNKLYQTAGAGFHVYHGTYTRPHIQDDHWECFIISDGMVVHHLNHTEKVLKKKQLYLLRPNDYHFFTEHEKTSSTHYAFFLSNEQVQSICASFNEQLYDKLNTVNGELSIMLSDAEFDEFSQEIQQLQTIDAADYETSGTLIRMIFARTISLAYHKLLFSNTDELPEIVDTIIRKMRSNEYISESIEAICKDLPYSHMQLSRLFKRYVGATMSEYFKQVKLNYALNLLKKTNLNTLEISGMIGYSSLSHFTREFKNFYGMPPASYRRNAQR